MKIICLIKFIPDVEDFKYDYDRHVLIRDNMNQILNPEDASALAFALMVKKQKPDTMIEVVTMGPLRVKLQLEELLRLHVDNATLISDPAFVGSDTYATSKILSHYLKITNADMILTGTHSLDGDTAHVPAQCAEWLNLPHLSNIIRIDINTLASGRPFISVDHDQKIVDYTVDLPAVLSLQKESSYKLPYVSYDDLELDVSSRLQILNLHDLHLKNEEVGFLGSKTKVVQTFAKVNEKREKQLVQLDDEGINTVFQFLKDKGFLA